MKFVIGRALTILSWDDPVTAFFEKVEKLCHSLGRPSRSDFVHFQIVEILETKGQSIDMIAALEMLHYYHFQLNYKNH